MNLAQKMSHYASHLSYPTLPKEVIHQTKRHLLDALACSLGALSSEPAHAIKKVVQHVKDPHGATLLGTFQKTSPDLAALYNGTLMRYLDYNDTYLSKEPAHPSDNISAALALAESCGRNGKDFMTALVLAYEIQCRLCDAASIRAHGWDHVTYGLFSTTLAASKLLKLSVVKMEHALGIAGVGHIALRQTRVGELSMWKGCAFANAARNGIFSAFLAEQGMKGPAPLFEGEFGFFKLVSGSFEINEWGGKNNRFKIMDCFIKYFPAEYHAQAAIEAALELGSKISNIHDIEKISVKTFKAACEIIAGSLEKWHPQSRETADHSLPYCVAVALIDGRVGLAQFSKRRISDLKLQKLIQKVTVEEDSLLTQKYPNSLPVHLKVIMKSGKVFEKYVENPKGHVARPLTDQEIEQKFKMLAKNILSSRQQEKILDQIWNLERLKDMGTFIRLFNCKRKA